MILKLLSAVIHFVALPVFVAYPEQGLHPVEAYHYWAWAVVVASVAVYPLIAEPVEVTTI
jgi:hypothetical protein